MSKETKTIHERVHEIQTTLKAPKSRFNAFAKFSYRSCEDILDALKPLLKGLVLTIGDEIIMLGDRFYVKATAEITDGNTSIKVSGYARECKEKKGMDEAQITGSASSYARKYALNGLFCIDDNRDPDHVSEDKTVTAKEKKEIEKKILGMTNEHILNYKCPENGGKYAGMTLKQISQDITDAGTHKGLGYIEKVIDYSVTTEEGYAFQQACKRYYNEVIAGQ